MSEATYELPSANNKPKGADSLPSMAEQITKDQNGKYTVDDPLVVPDEMKKLWLEKGRKLDSLVNKENKTSGLPESCIRLVKKPTNANNDYGSWWIFGEAVTKNCTTADSIKYPSAGTPPGTCNNGNKKYNFIRAANDCYKALKNNDQYEILYSGSGVEKFLALVIQNPQEKSPGNYDFLDGNFIFADTLGTSATMKLPPTTDNSKVFLYFEKGTTNQLPLENTCLGLPSPCKRNYFIFSEGNFAGSSGTATINGAIFLANGSKITGKLPDAIIEFNSELYKAIADAGIVKSKKDNSKPDNTPEELKKDNFYVPSTSHLKVSLQSQYASKEKIPDPENPEKENVDFIYAQPGILVLPRVIYLKTEDGVTSTDKLQEYYKVLYLNGAPNPPSSAAENEAYDCLIGDNGTNETACKLTSKQCSGKMCQDHPFYIVKYDGTGTFSNSSNSGASSSGATSGPTLNCSMPAYSPFPHGVKVSKPVLTCSNNNTPTDVTWQTTNANISSINWDSPYPVPGSYTNVTAKAKCGGNDILTSNVCGSFSVMNPNVTLICTNISGSIKAGSQVPVPPDGTNGIFSTGNFALNLGCDNGAGTTTAPANVRYPNISGTPVAGTYDNVVVSADCGAAIGLQTQCDGTLNVVGVKCEGLPQYVKAGTSITPTLTCVPTDFKRSDTASGSFSVPSNASPGTGYNIGASSISCSKGNITESSLMASCGTATVLGITCANLPTSVQKGSTITSKPNITCISGDNVTNETFYQNTSDYPSSGSTSGSFSFPWQLGSASRYFVTAQATCGSETGLRANCGVVNSVDNSMCQYENRMCPGITIDKVITASQNGQLGGNGNPICVFATNIEMMGNENGGNSNPLKVNEEILKHGDNSIQAGRCGNNGANGTQNWGQKTCAAALQGIEKVDGGYYIYVPNWIGDFKTVGGTPFCSGGTNPCQYNPDWCGGNSYGVNYGSGGSASNPTAIRPSVGKCSFIKDFNSISYSNGSTLVINGIEHTCTEDKCNLVKPATADGGYYIYLKIGTITVWDVGTALPNQQLGSPSCNAATTTVAKNCKNNIGSLPANPNPPLNPLTACFTYNNKCYVCDDSNRALQSSTGLYQSCWSNWVWSSVDANNIGTWYIERPCDGSDVSSSGTNSSSSAASSSSGSCTYAYQSSWCNGSPATATAVSTTPTNSGGTCFFVSDINKMQLNSGKINGVTPSYNNGSYFACNVYGQGNCASLLASNSISKQDGGYYIYTGGWVSDGEYTNGPPSCATSGGGSGGTCANWTPAQGQITAGCYKPTSSKTCSINCNSANCSINPGNHTATLNGSMSPAFVSGREYTVTGTITVNSCWQEQASH